MPLSSRMLRIFARAALVLLAGAVVQIADAANRTAVRSGNWSDATLATPPGATSNNAGGTAAGAGLVPFNTDTVFICSGVTVTLDANSANLGSLTINSGGVLQGNNTGKILNLNGNITNTGPSGAISFSGATAATIALINNSAWSATGAWTLNLT